MATVGPWFSWANRRNQQLTLRESVADWSSSDAQGDKGRFAFTLQVPYRVEQSKEYEWTPLEVLIHIGDWPVDPMKAKQKKVIKWGVASGNLPPSFCKCYYFQQYQSAATFLSGHRYMDVLIHELIFSSGADKAKMRASWELYIHNTIASIGKSLRKVSEQHNCNNCGQKESKRMAPNEWIK